MYVLYLVMKKNLNSFQEKRIKIVEFKFYRNLYN